MVMEHMNQSNKEIKLDILNSNERRNSVDAGVDGSLPLLQKILEPSQNISPEKSSL